jgi:thioesterase domain-containing protein
MQLEHFEREVKEKIPLAKDLQFSYLSCDEKELVLQAPFEKNKNDKNTVFAGSQASLALLAGWSLVTLSFQDYKVRSVAAMKTEMSYLKPIEGDFVVRAVFSDQADKSACINMLDKKGRTKISVDVTLSELGEQRVKASFNGVYFLSL